MPFFRHKIINLLLSLEKNVLLKFCARNFDKYLLLIYFYYSRLRDVTIITALLCHSAYVIIDDKVTKMERLNESQLRAQAVRMFEDNGKETKLQ